MSSILFALYFPATGFRKLPLVLFFSSWRAYSNLQNQARMKMWLKLRNFSNEILLLHYNLLIEQFWNSLLMCSSFWWKISIRDTAIARACLASDAHFATVVLNYGQYNGFLRPIPQSMPMKTLHSTAELPNWEIQFTPFALGTFTVQERFYIFILNRYLKVLPYYHYILAMLCLHHLHLHSRKCYPELLF